MAILDFSEDGSLNNFVIFIYGSKLDFFVSWFLTIDLSLFRGIVGGSFSEVFLASFEMLDLSFKALLSMILSFCMRVNKFLSEQTWLNER